MKYDVGDVVIIKSNLAEHGENGDYDGGVGYDKDMSDYAGMKVTITQVTPRSYHIREDGGNWWWTDDMFESEQRKECKEEEEIEVEHTAVNLIDKKQLVKEIYDTLDICEIYHPTDEGIDAVLEQWEEAKGKTGIWDGMSILDILSKHPDYVPEKGYIVKRNEYDRGVDFNVIWEVMNTIEYMVDNPMTYGLINEVEIRPWSYEECLEYRDKLNNIAGGMHYDSQMRWRGLTLEEVLREREIWQDRLRTLENTYVVHNYKCYLKEEREMFHNTLKLLRNIRNWLENKKATMSEEDLLNPLLIDETVANYIEGSGLTIRGIRAGQKFNKVIIKILTETKIKDRWSKYNKETARLGDAASPTKFTRFTIISANPLDYWRMSFGSSWKSCHTIDKLGNYRPSDGGDGYEGMHASGTSSYMGDPSTIVMYTVDKGYEGSDYEMEPKINRCLFHLGEGKFVMGRVYPQGTDGEEEVYRQWRNIFQQIIAECVGLPNYWKTIKDRDEKNEHIRSRGTHYRDYTCSYCDIAGFSYIKSTADTKLSYKYIVIGSTPICPCCGESHCEEDSIECSSCRSDGISCACCGYESDRENMHYIDGDWYCEDCCFYCDYHGEWERGESYYVEGYGDVCEYALESGDFADCENCGTTYYVGNGDDEGVRTEDGYWYCCSECAQRAGYVQAENDLWYPEDELNECPECGALVTDSDWDEDLGMCTHCAENHEEQTA